MNQKIQSALFKIFLCCVVLLLPCSSFFGCIEEPSEIGGPIIPKSDLPFVKIDTIYATSHTSKQYIKNNYSADRFMLGKYRSTWESRALLLFTGFPDSLRDIEILNAFIRLKSIYHFGDSSANLSFSAYRMINSWLRDSVTIDSLDMKPSDYYSPTPLQLSFSQSFSDTDYINVTIPDTDVVRKWFSSSNDTLQYNFGLLLVPTNANVIRGFSSYSSGDTAAMPQLNISYKKNGYTSTYTHSYSLSRYLSKAMNLVTDSRMIYVQGGLPYEGDLTFDVSSFPNPSIVNRAYLEVTMNSSLSIFNTYSHDSLLVSQLNTDGSINSLVLSLSSVRSDSLGYHIYKFDISSTVSSWIRKTASPKIAMLDYGEDSNFDLHVLYGSDTMLIPKSLRPRLIITHSTK